MSPLAWLGLVSSELCSVNLFLLLAGSVTADLGPQVPALFQTHSSRPSNAPPLCPLHSSFRSEGLGQPGSVSFPGEGGGLFRRKGGKGRLRVKDQ